MIAGATTWVTLIVQATVRIDPTVAITGTVAPIGTPPAFVAMPEVTSSDAPPGGTMQADVQTAAGDLVALMLGELGPPTSVPGLPGTFWFDPTAVFARTIGVQQPASPISGSLAVPSVASLRGASLAWQAITLGVGGLSVSNPSLALVE